MRCLRLPLAILILSACGDSSDSSRIEEAAAGNLCEQSVVVYCKTAWACAAKEGETLDDSSYGTSLADCIERFTGPEELACGGAQCDAGETYDEDAHLLCVKGQCVDGNEVEVCTGSPNTCTDVLGLDDGIPDYPMECDEVCS